MDNQSSSSSSFTSTHFIISFVTTALIFMGIIYWVSGCESKDYSMNPAKTTQESAPHPEGGHE